MDFEFQRAKRVGDAFEVIAQSMGEIVERVNAPLVSGLVMRGVPDAIEDRVAQPNVRRLHVDLGAQSARAIGKFARFHARKQVEVFFHGAVAKRSVLAEPPVFVGFSWRHVADVGFAFAHELLSEFVDLIEVIGSKERRAVAFQSEIFVRPAIDQPTDIGHDRVDEFRLFFFRVGVVHPHVADAAEFARDPEVEADRLGVSDMEIAVRLGREASVNFRVLSAAHIFCDDIADEIGRGGLVSRWSRHAVARR